MLGRFPSIGLDKFRMNNMRIWYKHKHSKSCDLVDSKGSFRYFAKETVHVVGKGYMLEVKCNDLKCEGCGYIKIDDILEIITPELDKQIK
jgi:hypothetical protein